MKKVIDKMDIFTEENKTLILESDCDENTKNDHLQYFLNMYEVLHEIEAEYEIYKDHPNEYAKFRSIMMLIEDTGSQMKSSSKHDSIRSGAGSRRSIGKVEDYSPTEFSGAKIPSNKKPPIAGGKTSGTTQPTHANNRVDDFEDIPSFKNNDNRIEDVAFEDYGFQPQPVINAIKAPQGVEQQIYSSNNPTNKIISPHVEAQQLDNKQKYPIPLDVVQDIPGGFGDSFSNSPINVNPLNANPLMGKGTSSPHPAIIPGGSKGPPKVINNSQQATLPAQHQPSSVSQMSNKSPSPAPSFPVTPVSNQQFIKPADLIVPLPVQAQQFNLATEDLAFEDYVDVNDNREVVSPATKAGVIEDFFLPTEHLAKNNLMPPLPLVTTTHPGIPPKSPAAPTAQSLEEFLHPTTPSVPQFGKSKPPQEGQPTVITIAKEQEIFNSFNPGVKQDPDNMKPKLGTSGKQEDLPQNWSSLNSRANILLSGYSGIYGSTLKKPQQNYTGYLGASVSYIKIPGDTQNPYTLSSGASKPNFKITSTLGKSVHTYYIPEMNNYQPSSKPVPAALQPGKSDAANILASRLNDDPKDDRVVLADRTPMRIQLNSVVEDLTKVSNWEKKSNFKIIQLEDAESNLPLEKPQTVSLIKHSDRPKLELTKVPSEDSRPVVQSVEVPPLLMSIPFQPKHSQFELVDRFNVPEVIRDPFPTYFSNVVKSGFANHPIYAQKIAKIREFFNSQAGQDVKKSFYPIMRAYPGLRTEFEQEKSVLELCDRICERTGDMTNHSSRDGDQAARYRSERQAYEDQAKADILVTKRLIDESKVIGQASGINNYRLSLISKVSNPQTMSFSQALLSIQHSALPQTALNYLSMPSVYVPGAKMEIPAALNMPSQLEITQFLSHVRKPLSLMDSSSLLVTFCVNEPRNFTRLGTQYVNATITVHNKTNGELPNLEMEFPRSNEGSYASWIRTRSSLGEDLLNPPAKGNLTKVEFSMAPYEVKSLDVLIGLALNLPYSEPEVIFHHPKPYTASMTLPIPFPLHLYFPSPQTSNALLSFFNTGNNTVFSSPFFHYDADKLTDTYFPGIIPMEGMTRFVGTKSIGAVAVYHDQNIRIGVHFVVKEDTPEMMIELITGSDVKPTTAEGILRELRKWFKVH
jgi:hypothetical protein